MRLHDTVLRMRELLTERGVDLRPSTADARAIYEGPGASAQDAWEAFRAVALEPAFDPIREWGELQEVTSAGFRFEAMFSPGWAANRHSPESVAMPEHYELDFTRQFNVGDAGDLMGLSLTVFVRAADELRTLEASLFGGYDGAAAEAWIAEVEASPAFVIPMTRHDAERFSFGVDEIG